MKPNNTIIKALEHYLIHIQMGNHYDWEKRLKYAKDKLSFIENGGTVDEDWIKSSPLFFTDVFQTYSDFLKRSIQDAIPDDEDVCRLQEERRIINTLLNALKQFLNL